MTSTTKKVLLTLAVTLIWALIWFAVAIALDNPLLVPTPVAVVSRLVELGSTEAFWKSVLFSILRIMLGFILGVVLGVLFSVSSFLKSVDAMLSPLMTVIKATPVASFIMLAWIWLKRNDIPIFVSMLMVIPIVWSNVSGAIKSVDKKLLEVAKVYRFGKLKTLKHVYLPHVLPGFVTSLKICSGLVWKAGVAAEVLCQPQNSIGASLFNAKNILDTVDVFAWTLVVIIISLCLEKLIKFLADAQRFRKND